MKEKSLDMSETTENSNEWIYVLDQLPIDGEKVICYGHKTICCELDMDEACEHEAIYKLKESSWKEGIDGNRYDIKTYHDFEFEDEMYHLMFVSRWKKV